MANETDPKTATTDPKDTKTSAPPPPEPEKKATPAKKPAKYEFQAMGVPDGKYTLGSVNGTFGASGTVMFGGKQLPTSEWSSERIVGNLPADAISGPVDVYLDSETVRRGYLTVASK